MKVPALLRRFWCERRSARCIESGVDFERRIATIYQECRTTDAIERQFAQLRFDLRRENLETMDDTRRKLLENST